MPTLGPQNEDRIPPFLYPIPPVDTPYQEETQSAEQPQPGYPVGEGESSSVGSTLQDDFNRRVQRIADLAGTSFQQAEVVVRASDARLAQAGSVGVQPVTESDMRRINDVAAQAVSSSGAAWSAAAATGQPVGESSSESSPIASPDAPTFGQGLRNMMEQMNEMWNGPTYGPGLVNGPSEVDTPYFPVVKRQTSYGVVELMTYIRFQFDGVWYRRRQRASISGSGSYYSSDSRGVLMAHQKLVEDAYLALYTDAYNPAIDERDPCQLSELERMAAVSKRTQRNRQRQYQSEYEQYLMYASQGGAAPISYEEFARSMERGRVPNPGYHSGGNTGRSQNIVAYGNSILHVAPDDDPIDEDNTYRVTGVPSPNPRSEVDMSPDVGRYNPRPQMYMNGWPVDGRDDYNLEVNRRRANRGERISGQPQRTTMHVGESLIYLGETGFASSVDAAASEQSATDEAADPDRREIESDIGLDMEASPRLRTSFERLIESARQMSRNMEASHLEMQRMMGPGSRSALQRAWEEINTRMNRQITSRFGEPVVNPPADATQSE